ncbi:MAG: helicase HerA domain-containing protein [bacterium]
MQQIFKARFFQIHKVQAAIDPLTNAELQWGALKADILGTYYDSPEQKIAFGNDIDSFVPPHFYEIYVPKRKHLEVLINCFVAEKNPVQIGRLRYTETETLHSGEIVPVSVSPDDFLCNRTALFGKTRMGKSNTIKVILDTMLRRETNLRQIVFDLSGEYTYPDPQTGISLYLTHRDKCTRYSLNPRSPDRERSVGTSPPEMLKINFYNRIALGHSLICSLYNTKHNYRPNYMEPFFAWEPIDASQITTVITNFSEQKRFRRALSV